MIRGAQAVAQTGGMEQLNRVHLVRRGHMQCGGSDLSNTPQWLSRTSKSRFLLVGAVAILAVTCAVQALAAGPEAQAWGIAGFLDTMHWTGGQLVEAARTFHARAPALALGMASVALLLPLALLTLGVRVVVAARHSACEPEALGASERTSLVTGFSLPRRARLEGAELGKAGSLEIRRTLTRIGRADDNEIVINSADLEPYHAAIERTPECDLYLCDLTRGGRFAARVNGGKARPRRRLSDGDVIMLGRVRLTYRTSAL